MKPTHLATCLAIGTAISLVATIGQPVHLDLTSQFDTDAVLEPGGTPLSGPLDLELERIDGQSLPTAYADGTAFTTPDGRASFLFAPLRSASRDALVINGQTLTCPAAPYAFLDLALLAAPNSYGNPFSAVEFRYTDGSREARRFGPVPGWLASPTAFDHSFFAYTDDSGVQTISSFDADFGAVEAGFILQQRGNGNANGVRFVDGTGYVLYDIPIDTQVTEATLGITVGNNFVVSLAALYSDPEISLTEGFTVVANSMELHNEFEHRALGNFRLYEFDLAPFLAGADHPGGIYLLLTDATPENGWGPYIQDVSVYTGETVTFSETITPQLDASQATLHAEFLTDGGSAELPYLYDNSGSGPSNRRHRFADSGGSLTYRFDLPDDISEAQLTVDMANNFVVALSGPIDQTRYALVTPGAPDESDYLLDEGNSILDGNYRFADGTAYMVYEFDLPDDITGAVAQITVGNQFVIGVAAGDGPFVTERDYVAETGIEIRDNSNLGVYEIDLADHLTANPGKVVRIRLSDGQPADGWGPFLTRIAIVNQAGTGQGNFQTVLRSTDLFDGLDIRTEINKACYTIDLAPILQSDNPTRQVYVKFTDGSTADGWGPGLFWMAVHTGPITIHSDQSVFEDLKAMNDEPQGFGLTLLHRRYPVDSAKTLEQIVLPAQSTLESNIPYLLAATLNPATAEVRLTVELATNNTLRLSWPVSAVDYRLESADILSANWTDASEQPALEDARYVVTLPTTESQRYFRLSK